MIDLEINNLFVEAGAYGYTLKRKVKRNVKDKTTGEVHAEDAFDNISYHGNLEATLTAALNETVRTRIATYPEDISLAIAIRDLRSLYMEFTELLKCDVGRFERIGGDGDA